MWCRSGWPNPSPSACLAMSYQDNNLSFIYKYITKYFILKTDSSFEGVNKMEPSFTNYSRVDILRLAYLSASSAHDISVVHQLTLSRETTNCICRSANCRIICTSVRTYSRSSCAVILLLEFQQSLKIIMLFIKLTLLNKNKNYSKAYLFVLDLLHSFLGCQYRVR